MKRTFRRGFFQRIVLPAMLAIILFVISLFAFVLPSFERNGVEQKKQMLNELTNTAWSILNKYYTDASTGKLSLEDAQNQAINEIQALRYGHGDKDYFWITDLEPSMIMHPYVHELTGKSLNDYADPDGKKLFIEAVQIARTEGEGFINYKWQLRDDSLHIVPKLSFVKLFPQWNWIIGTGIYLDDIQAELKSLTNKLLLILVVITLIISVIISFITYQSHEIENKRVMAEAALMESREKYKSLIESSTEGIILLVNSHISYSNSHIQNWLKYTAAELQVLSPEDIFAPGNRPELAGIEKETGIETVLICKDGVTAEALLTVLPVQFAGKEGLLMTFRDIAEHRSVKMQLAEMKSRLRNLSESSNDGMNHFASYVSVVSTLENNDLSTISLPHSVCRADSTIAQAVEILSKDKSGAVIVMMDNSPIGIITPKDVLVRFMGSGKSAESKVVEIMSAPLISADSAISVSEAAVIMERNKISHLAVKDGRGKITALAGMHGITRSYLNSAEAINSGILKAGTVEELAGYRKKIPYMVKPLLHELGNVNTFNRILSGFNDSITTKIIENAIREVGEPPVPFTFISFGSGGRSELTFNSDQDNAIIYADDSSLPPEELNAYFLELGTKVCNHLDAAGLDRCPGGYMASNPKWCQPLSVWKEYFTDWIVNANPENILHFSVFFDLKQAFGDEGLFNNLEDFIFDSLKERSAFFYFLAQSVISTKVPVQGHTISDQGSSRRKEESIDIKSSMAPVVMLARIYALHNNIRLKSTLERINALRTAGVLSQQTCDEVTHQYNFLMFHRLGQQIVQIISRDNVTNDIVPSRMSEIDQAALKKIFSQINGYHERLSAEFMSAYKG